MHLKLEYNYLSSGEKLMNLREKFFNEDLSARKKNEIQTIQNNN